MSHNKTARAARMVKSSFLLPIRTTLFLWMLLLSVLVGLTACSPGGVEIPANAPSPTVAQPTQTPLPAPTHTPSPTVTAALLPTKTAPAAPTSPPTTQPVYRPQATYICPWTEQTKALPVYTYQVLNTFPHDPTSYTQGLIYRDSTLYEGSGLYGQSTLRQVTLESGNVEKMIQLPQQYFGEGITELDGRLYQLTWREGVGFVYDAESFEQLQTFSYPFEGWGLTHDGARLILSDGSPNLYFLNPESLQIIGQIAVTAENIPVPRLNELEYVEGEVWANVYQTACIARIDPASGNVLGWIDITGILPMEDLPGSEVPNGIAYDPDGKRIFITGKLWPKLFEIAVVQK